MGIPVYVKRTPAPMKFPHIQRELLRIGGPRPDGKGPRLLLDWMGEATRPFEDVVVAKKSMGTEQIQTHWRFMLDPTVAQDQKLISRNGGHMFIDIEELDLDKIDDAVKCRADGSLRIALPMEAIVDYALPNYWISDWMHPAKLLNEGWNVERFGPEPREGYYFPIFRIHNPDPKFEDIAFYRHPDELDVELAREYQREKETEFQTMGKHFDQPLGKDDIRLLNTWAAKAIQTAREKSKAERVEEIFGGLKEEIAGRKRIYGFGTFGN